MATLCSPLGIGNMAQADKCFRVGALACALAALALALALPGCAELPSTPSGAPPASFLPDMHGAARQAVGVQIAGWHSGLVLSATELGMLQGLLVHAAGARYVSIGWGNRRFYRAAHPGSGDALAALFPSRSVLLVQTFAHASDAVAASGRVDWVCADRTQLWRIDLYVRDSLQLRSGRALDLGAGPRRDGQFYASSAHYDAFHTCNTWTVATLQFAGYPVTAAGVVFAGQVGRRIRSLPMCPPRAG